MKPARGFDSVPNGLLRSRRGAGACGRPARSTHRFAPLNTLISLLLNSGALALCLLLIAGAIACGNAANRNAQACGPFGNLPARIIGTVKRDCDGGKLLGPWKDADRTDRYACLYEPRSAGVNNRLPMVVYLHPSLFPVGPSRWTNLLEYQDSVSLSEDVTKAGFIVLAPQGRKTTHYYPFPNDSGAGWDNWYRQLSPAGEVKVGDTSYRGNVDATAIDHFIAEEVATGKVDKNRIYMTGWSAGAAMGYLYALNRPSIAALAVYSAPNPFGALDDPCPQKPVTGAPLNDRQIQIFNPHVPTMHIHNSCDIVGICPNGEKLESDLRPLGVEVQDMILGPLGRPMNACMASCGTDPNGDAGLNPLGWTLGVVDHLQWPRKQTPAMLKFFRSHPLKVSP